MINLFSLSGEYILYNYIFINFYHLTYFAIHVSVVRVFRTDFQLQN